jgi:hypothetical protein
MKSPTGSRQTLTPITLEDGLTAYQCPESGGHYIPAAAYMRWLSKQPARSEHLPPGSGTAAEERPSENAYLCPETDSIMTRYKVGHGFRFTIDRSITGGVWLDAGEWEALRQRNFHDEIHFIFTDPWQRKILREALSTSASQRLEARLGSDLFARLTTLKQEIANHPHQAEIHAFLTRD